MEILEIQNFNKFPLFTISSFFQHFWHFVFYFTYPNLSKTYGIFCSVLFEGLQIRIVKVLLKKILICEIFFFSKFYSLLFFLFLTFYFQFRLSVLVKKLQKFLRFFILWIKDFIKEIWKIMEYFSKKYRYLKSKIHHKFNRLLFVFFLLVGLLPAPPLIKFRTHTLHNYQNALNPS